MTTTTVSVWCIMTVPEYVDNLKTHSEKYNFGNWCFSVGYEEGNTSMFNLLSENDQRIRSLLEAFSDMGTPVLKMTFRDGVFYLVCLDLDDKDEIKHSVLMTDEEVVDFIQLAYDKNFPLEGFGCDEIRFQEL